MRQGKTENRKQKIDILYTTYHVEYTDSPEEMTLTGHEVEESLAVHVTVSKPHIAM